MYQLDLNTLTNFGIRLYVSQRFGTAHEIVGVFSVRDLPPSIGLHRGLIFFRQCSFIMVVAAKVTAVLDFQSLYLGGGLTNYGAASQ